MKCHQKQSGVLRRKLLVGSFLLCLSLTVGCSKGPESGSVTITVTSGGAPVTEGSVQMIIAKEGKAAGGELDSAGKASLSEVEVGSYVVYVTPPSEAPPVAGQAPPVPKNYDNIPAKYRSESTSPLKAEVKKGGNEFTFDLKE